GALESRSWPAVKTCLRRNHMTSGRGRQIIGAGILSGVVERDLPEPVAGEVLLRVHATSVNFHDLIGIDGGIPGLPMPRVPFSDASATVLELGAGVEGFAVGDHVIPGFFPNWERGPIDAAAMSPILGDQVDGTLQTHLCISARSIAHAPADMPHQAAATLGCAGLTAWRSVVEEAKVRPGQTVLLQGTGGVSLAALAFARMLGARVIITSSSDEKLTRARALGAHETINYTATPDWQSAVLDMTDGRGADLVVEAFHACTFGHASRHRQTAVVRSLRRGEPDDPDAQAVSRTARAHLPAVSGDGRTAGQLAAVGRRAGNAGGHGYRHDYAAGQASGEVGSGHQAAGRAGRTPGRGGSDAGRPCPERRDRGRARPDQIGMPDQRRPGRRTPRDFGNDGDVDAPDDRLRRRDRAIVTDGRSARRILLRQHGDQLPDPFA
nr:hypothetical protein [Tanacetum cinerariifolium]